MKSASFLPFFLSLSFSAKCRGFRLPKAISGDERAVHDLSRSKSTCRWMNLHAIHHRRPGSSIVLPQGRLSVFRGGAAVAAASTTIGGGSLKVTSWIGTALVCALSYALYNLFIKKASASIDPILGGVLLQFVAALLGTVLYVAKQVLTKTGASAASNVPTQCAGVQWAIAAGAAVGSAEILSFVISSMGVPATQSIPVIIGGSVTFGTLLGSIWLKESVSWKGWIGVFLISLGIAFIGADSAGGMH